MPRITVNFADVQEFEVLDKGEYHGVIVKAEWREPEDENKYPYINLEIDVTDEEFKGRKLWTILSTSPKALWRMKQVFENLGIYMEEVDLEVDDDSGLVVSPELVGIPVLCAVSKRVYEGREQNQVDAITSPTGGGGATTKKSSAKKSSGPARGGAKKFR